jgi:sporulation protein YlmC with PRC-barrel domain|tara:strand:+ start:296 stop:559 length:264 start_codon:yes stop_codon:yes gene_type:complete
MTNNDKKYSKQILGKTIVTKTGKKFGELGNILFDTKTGELLQLELKNTTSLANGLDLERTENGQLLIPYSAVIAIGDFIVVAEEDII